MTNSIRPIATVAVLLAVLTASRAQALRAGIARAAIDQALTNAVARHDLPGVVAIVVNRQGIVYDGIFGMADASTARPMARDTVFRIYSMTKPITSVAAMQLVERGLLKLDTPASDYLPELSTIPVLTSLDPATGQYSVRPPAKPVTLRHLLTHTAGFGYNFDSAVTRDFKPQHGDKITEVLLFEPGAQWWYGTNTDWVGRIVERVSGQTLDDYFRVHVLGPLQMNDTFFNVPESAHPRTAAIHRRGADDTLTATPTRFQAATTFSGGGGLYSTAADYARFIRMLLNGGSLDGVRILSRDTVASMTRNQIDGVSARALKTALPAISSDFSFVNDGRDKFGLGFLISVAPRPRHRSAGSLSWAGLANTWFWVDPRRGIGGLFLTQLLPFADTRVLAAYDAYEQAVYTAIH
jgi:methyl acetate hydrolase